MKKSKIAVLVAMVVVLAFSLWQHAAEATRAAVTNTVVYKVGTEPTFPPFDTTDEDQNIVGLDMDLIKAIGEDQGFDVRIRKSVIRWTDPGTEGWQYRHRGSRNEQG